MAFILGVTSVVIYYVLLFDLSYLCPRSTNPNSLVNLFLLGMIVSFFIGLAAIIIGLANSPRPKSDARGKFFDRVGVVYGAFTIVIWFFLIFSYIFVSVNVVIIFKNILTILSIFPIVLSFIFLIKFRKICKKYFKNAILILFIFIIPSALIGCGPQVAYEVSSNPAWMPNSDKIAYIELVTYEIGLVETSDVYERELVLVIKSLRNPFFHRRIKLTVPKTSLTERQISPNHVSFSPDGHKIVFSMQEDSSAFKKGEIFIADIKRGTCQKIADNGLNPEWSPKENIIIYQGANVGQSISFVTDNGEFEFSSDSTEGRKENNLFKKTKIFLTTDRKQEQIVLFKLLMGKKPKWAPDGDKVIFVISDYIFFTDKYGNTIRQMKIPYDSVGDPSFSPDMTKIIFCKYRKGYQRFEPNLYIANATTGAIEREIIEPNGKCMDKNATVYDSVWSPDGECIAFMYNASIFLIKKDGTGLKLICGYRRSRPGW